MGRKYEKHIFICVIDLCGCLDDLFVHKISFLIIVILYCKKNNFFIRAIQIKQVCYIIIYNCLFLRTKFIFVIFVFLKYFWAHLRHFKHYKNRPVPPLYFIKTPDFWGFQGIFMMFFTLKTHKNRRNLRFSVSLGVLQRT